jgi:hypothetical protein
VGTFHRGLGGLLIEVESAVSHRQYPPPVEGHDNSSRGENVIPELPQRLQQRLEVGIQIPRQPPPPSLLRSKEDEVRERRQPPVVVAEVELPALPPLIR